MGLISRVSSRTYRSSCKSQKMDDFADLLETNDLTDLTSTVNEGLDKLSLGDNPLNAIPSRHSLKSQTDSSDSGLPKTEPKKDPPPRNSNRIVGRIHLGLVV